MVLGLWFENKRVNLEGNALKLVLFVEICEERVFFFVNLPSLLLPKAVIFFFSLLL